MDNNTRIKRSQAAALKSYLTKIRRDRPGTELTRAWVTSYKGSQWLASTDSYTAVMLKLPDAAKTDSVLTVETLEVWLALNKSSKAEFDIMESLSEPDGLHNIDLMAAAGEKFDEPEQLGGICFDPYRLVDLQKILSPKDEPEASLRFTGPLTAIEVSQTYNCSDHFGLIMPIRLRSV